MGSRSSFGTTLNRMDDVVVFSPLTKPQIVAIIDLAVADISRRLADKNITLTMTDKAKAYVAEQAYDPNYGARPVKRYLQGSLETELARKIVAGEIYDGCSVTADAGEGGLAIIVQQTDGQ